MAKSITFIVTKDCQLACKYCYLVGKNEKERMPWEVAKAAIDYILDHEHDDVFNTESVIFDFIGGEPFLEIELIDRICDYLKVQMFSLGHHWFNSYRFSFSTNGINYDSEAVQRFIRKNLDHLSIGITIDGTRRKHDLNQVWKHRDGEPERGSYDDVVRNIPLWLNQFPNGGTKVTISSADIPYICESVLHLYSLGIKEVNINCIFEDVWHEGDGIDKNRLRPFLTLDRLTQSPRECIDCEVASGCAWCQGENYDAAAPHHLPACHRHLQDAQSPRESQQLLLEQALPQARNGRVIAFFLGKMGIITAPMLTHYRRHAIMVIAVVAAIITPPDVMSLILVAIPLCLLYEVSIRIVACIGKKNAM